MSEELEKQAAPNKKEQSLLKVLIAKGKEQGYLTYAEVNDHLPDGIVDPEQIEDIINMINDMGIKVYESPPDLDIIMTDSTEGPDEEAAAEAAAGKYRREKKHGLHEIHVEGHGQENRHRHGNLQTWNRPENQANQNAGYDNQPQRWAREQHLERRGE